MGSVGRNAIDAAARAAAVSPARSEPGHAVVADFGIGKAIVAAASEPSTFTQIGVTVGTPAYLSPEQATGEELDGRSDLVALGCVLDGTPVPLFSGPYVFHSAWDEGRSYDVTKDGETFVMLREPPGRQRRRIVVTFNWVAELAEKVPR